MEKLKLWGPFLAVLALLVIALIFKAPLLEGMSLIALVWVTMVYAIAAHKQAKEMREQRYDAVRPIIDIQVQLTGNSLIVGLYVSEGKLPKGMPCILRNIGLGPATDANSLIEGLAGECLWRGFGTLAKGEKTREIRFFLGQEDGRSAFVVYYRDIYGRPLESSRQISGDKERVSIEMGPLRIRQLAEKDWPKFTMPKGEIPPPAPEY